MLLNESIYVFYEIIVSNGAKQKTSTDLIK